MRGKRKSPRKCDRLAFDNYETTDDHGMHMTGIVKDQTGKNITSLKIHGAQATTTAMVTSMLLKLL